MRGKIVAIANQKGGVGKTFLALHLGAFLARRDKRVILLDADPQGSLTSYLLDRNLEEAGVVRLLISKSPPLKVVVPVRGEWQLGLIPGNWETGNALSYLTMGNIPFNAIAQRIRPLAQHADHVLIDMPPSRIGGFLQVLYAADLVLIPTQLERLSIEGVGFMADAAHTLIQEHGNGPRLLGIVPNMARHTNEHAHFLARLKGAYGPTIWDPIPQSIKVTEACSDGISLFRHAPTAAVTSAVSKVCETFLENTR